MDKPTFLDYAPSFYSVAVACTLLEGKQREIWTVLQIKEGVPPALHAILVHDALVEAALRVLVAAGVVAHSGLGSPAAIAELSAVAAGSKARAIL